jgi:hypothetical protein
MKKPRHMMDMYEKYSTYVTNILPSRCAKYAIEYRKTYTAVAPDDRKLRHHQ